MSESASLKSIEGDGAGMSGRIAIEEELGIAVDKATDQPGRGDPVNPWTRSCDPLLIAIFLLYPSATLSGSGLWSDAVIGPSKESLHPASEGAVEEVDRGDLLEAPAQTPERARSEFGNGQHLLQL